MATTVKDLIEYLRNIPLDTELRVVMVDDCGHDQCASFVPMDLSEYTGNVDYTDLTGNPFVKEDSALCGRRFLDFGKA